MGNEPTGWKPDRAELSEFLRTQPTCTFSTITADNTPQGATVAFSETVDGHFIIGTRETSRKAANIQSNPHVAMTVTDIEKRYTVQLEGKARILSVEEFEPYAEEHYRQLPISRPFKGIPGEINILITPSYIRFSDCSSKPWTLTDFTN